MFNKYNRNSTSSRGGNFGGRSRFSGGSGRSRFGVQGGKKGNKKTFSDLNKFINKATPSQEVEVYKPQNQFADFDIDAQLKSNILSKGYKNPTPIQDKTIQPILDGNDVVGLANTGTGKTAAFLIPLINKVLKNRNENVLIMAPTRELAIQIQDELRGFTKDLKIFSVCGVGGASIWPQIKQLKFKNNFIIGTPGRLKDLIDRKLINLKTFSSVVLDEADRMLDMGFINDMNYIMGLMPENRQTLFFSATMSDDIKRLVSKFLRDPISISVKTRDTSKSIDQDVVKVHRDQNKLDILNVLLQGVEFSKVLIFGSTKRGVEKLTTELNKFGHLAESIHGDKNHSKRQKALGLFKTNKVNILVATDVAARGLDISGVTHVINYELPSTYEDYIHRIGRTGRGNQTGKALTFVMV